MGGLRGRPRFSQHSSACASAQRIQVSISRELCPRGYRRGPLGLVAHAVLGSVLRNYVSVGRWSLLLVNSFQHEHQLLI